jgi:heme-degrading monooxygenase HmoA
MAEHVRVLLYLHTDDPDALAAAYGKVSADLAGTPGLLRNELLRCSGRPGRYAIASEWRSRAEFRTWEDGPAHRDATAPVRGYQDASMSPPFAVYEVIEEWVEVTT